MLIKRLKIKSIVKEFCQILGQLYDYVYFILYCTLYSEKKSNVNYI